MANVRALLAQVQPQSVHSERVRPKIRRLSGMHIVAPLQGSHVGETLALDAKVQVRAC